MKFDNIIINANDFRFQFSFKEHHTTKIIAVYNADNQLHLVEEFETVELRDKRFAELESILCINPVNDLLKEIILFNEMYEIVHQLK